MHVVWMNESAYGKGGAERYVRETAAHLRARGVRSTLLYDVHSPVDPEYVVPFDGAYPGVDLWWQLRELSPDVIYVHRVAEGDTIAALAHVSAPTLRFFHDHQLFCLREHKYTALGHETCTRPVGLGCYACVGFVQRAPPPVPVRLVSVSSLRRAQRDNQALAGFVVGSRYMGEHVAAHGFDRAKIHVLPLAADVPSSVVAATRERDLVLFVGQLVRGKGLDVLLCAIARSQAGARLLIVGDGRQGHELRALATSLRLGGRVTFAGPVSSAELGAFYARARCLALPSRAPETFGLAGLEALSHGLPVVASDVGGVREWLEDGKNGVAVPSGDVAGFARAIDHLIRDDDRAAAMSREAVATHRARFLPEHHAERLHGLLQRVAGQQTGAP